MAPNHEPNTRRSEALQNARWGVARAIHEIETEFGFKDGLPILQPLAIAIQEIDNRRRALTTPETAGKVGIWPI